jgi:hypothetical protein
MAKNKISIDFPGYELLKKQLDELGGDATMRAIESALKASQQVVAEKVSAAMAPHTMTGRTKKSIVIDAPVEWTGDQAAVGVGFNIVGGGLPSIFLMYGTKLHGQPHIKPDRNLYNAVYGPQTRKEIMQIQEQAFEKVLGRLTAK